MREDSIEDLFVQKGAWLFNYANKILKNATEAEDAVSATMVTLLRVVQQGKYKGTGPLQAYARVVLKNECLGVFRKRRRRKEQTLQEWGLTATTEPIERSDRNEAIGILVPAIAKIKRRRLRETAEALLQHHTVKDAQESLGVSRKYMGVLSHRARATLREILDAEGMDLVDLPEGRTR